jgi:hypothetical protein
MWNICFPAFVWEASVCTCRHLLKEYGFTISLWIQGNVIYLCVGFCSRSNLLVSTLNFLLLWRIVSEWQFIRRLGRAVWRPTRPDTTSWFSLAGSLLLMEQEVGGTKTIFWGKFLKWKKNNLIETNNQYAWPWGVNIWCPIILINEINVPKINKPCELKFTILPMELIIHEVCHTTRQILIYCLFYWNFCINRMT